MNTKDLATKIADKLLWINGINQAGTTIAPAIDGKYAGSYCRSELIREIQSVLNTESRKKWDL